MRSRDYQLLKLIGRYALVLALLVSQAAWVSHGHPASSAGVHEAAGYSANSALTGASADAHRHAPSADIDCLLCLAADLTPLDTLRVDDGQTAHLALLVANRADAPTLLSSILAYQTRAPPLFATA